MAAWDHALANFASIDHAAEQTGIFVVRKNTFTRILFNGFFAENSFIKKNKNDNTLTANSTCHRVCVNVATDNIDKLDIEVSNSQLADPQLVCSGTP
jgi:hypothetical protein